MSTCVPSDTASHGLGHTYTRTHVLFDVVPRELQRVRAVGPLRVKQALHVALGVLACDDGLLELDKLRDVDAAVVVRVHDTVQQRELVPAQRRDAAAAAEGRADDLNELLPADRAVPARAPTLH